MPSLSLHHLLLYSHRDAMGIPCSPILWDLREPPSSCVRHISSPTKRIPAAQLAQPATYPPVSALRITCDVFPFPWPIEARNHHGVTILDVLDAIYNAARARIRPLEWDRMAEKHKERVGAHFHHRWTSSPDPPRVRANGVVRSDCLLQSTYFAGLSPSPELGFVFILSLGRPRHR